MSAAICTALPLSFSPWWLPVTLSPHLPTSTPPACLQGPRSFFSEIISSINDIRFSPCGRYILSRDYMTLKVGHKQRD